MKKVILVCLCVLFVAGTSAFGYSVSGLVKDESGNTVSGATVYINCYPAAGGSLSDTDTSGNNGFYSGGWPLTNCVNENIVVKAVSGSKSGTVSWNAQHEAEVQNITISNTLHPTAELHCEAEPMPMSEPYYVESSPVLLYKQAYVVGPILVNGGSTTMQYDTQTMSCSSVQSNPPFTYSFSYSINPTSGTINVNAYAPPGVYVSVQNGENPTPFFTLKLAALNYSTPGKISNVTLTSSEIAIQSSGTKSAFPSRTEYVIGEPNAGCNPYHRIVSQQDWEEALSSGYVYAMDPEDWEYYMLQWQIYKEEGPNYPDSNFLQARPPEGQLYVYGGGGGGAYDPCDAGLVMGWGHQGMPTGSYCSAWKFDYLKDPDLQNCIITVVVTAPQFGASGQINQVSFGLQNAPVPGGPIRSWYWNCGAAGSGAPITWGVPTQIKIDTTKVRVAAATPVATAYASNPAFNLQNVQWLIVDENGNWLGGSPPPGPGGFQFLWNYWHWLIISPKTTLSKDYYKKWTQPPVILDANMPIFLGWDEQSDYNMVKIVADDWQCKDDRPITDIHWWGSFIGWNEPYPPPVVPKAFHIGIWTDVPDPDPCDPLNFSHPGTLIWQNYCDNFVWNFAGYDSDPRVFHDPCVPMEPNEACFQYNQLLSQDEWFHQELNSSDPNGRVYWISISAIWPAGTKPYQWGWKTRPHYWNDDAVQIQQLNPQGPPTLGSKWVNGNPITFPPYPNPDSVSFDMAFELTTNEPAYSDNPITGDLNADKTVDFLDFAVIANNWLTTVLVP